MLDQTTKNTVPTVVEQRDGKIIVTRNHPDGRIETETIHPVSRPMSNEIAVEERIHRLEGNLQMLRLALQRFGSDQLELQSQIEKMRESHIAVMDTLARVARRDIDELNNRLNSYNEKGWLTRFKIILGGKL